MASNRKDKRTVKKTWSKVETINLIGAYEARPDLWNPSRPKYHDRVLKQSLLAEIAMELDVPSVEITAKFHALRSQFNRELNKERTIKSGSSTDETYVSRWEFKSSLQFLQVNTVAGNTVSNLDTYEISSSPSSASSPSSESITVLDSDSQSESAAPTVNNKRARSQQTARNKPKRRAPDSQSEEDCLIEQAISIMKNDEFDIFGQFVANELRLIENPTQRGEMKREIMRVLMSPAYQQYPNGNSMAYPNSSNYSANNMQQFCYPNLPYSGNNNIAQNVPYPNNVITNYQVSNGDTTQNFRSTLASTQTASENVQSNEHQTTFGHTLDLIGYTQL